MSAPAAAAKPFDVVIGGAPLVEEIIAAKLLSGKPCVPIKGVKIDEAFYGQFKAKRVLVCGSYLSKFDLHQIVQVANRVDVWFYSTSDLERYRRGLITSLKTDLFTLDKFKDFPHVTRLLRRSLDPSHEEQDNDEAFYRGLLYNFRSSGKTHNAIITMWAESANVLRFNPLQEKLYIKFGRMIAEVQAEVAMAAVKAGAVVVSRGTLKLRVVVGLCTMVMPLVHEAVAQDFCDDYDIGVVIRFNLTKKTTMLTFVTHNATDLSFVAKAPWLGGGRDGCKGCELQGLYDLNELLKRLGDASTASQGAETQPALLPLPSP